MVGVDVVTTDRYAGSANLAATFGEGQRMDVSFTEIANVETGVSARGHPILGIGSRGAVRRRSVLRSFGP